MRAIVVTSVLLRGQLSHGDSERQAAIVFRWENLPDAVAYLLEISEGESFSDPLLKERVPHNYYRWKELGRRKYFWRVRGIDARGRQGEPGEPQIVGPVVSAPEQENPAEGARVGYGADAPVIDLVWKGSPGLDHAIVEISTDGRFGELLSTHVVKSRSTYSFSPPHPGTFHWRVAAVDLQGKEILPLSQRHVVVVAKRPELIQAKLNQSNPYPYKSFQVELVWEKRPVARYEINIARDRAFEKNAVTVFTNAPSATYAPTAPGKYHWRVRGRQPDTAWSRPGSFSLVQEEAERLSTSDNKRRSAGRSHAVRGRALQDGSRRHDVDRSELSSRLYIATSAGWFSSLGEIRAPRIDAEIGYRAELGGRELRLGLRAGHFMASTSLPRGFYSEIPLVLHAFPIALRGTYTLIPGRFVNLYAGGGAILSVIDASTKSSRQPHVRSRSFDLGLLASAGLIRRVGLGSAFIEFDYAHILREEEFIVEMNPSGISATIGYLIDIW